MPAKDLVNKDKLVTTFDLITIRVYIPSEPDIGGADSSRNYTLLSNR